MKITFATTSLQGERDSNQDRTGALLGEYRACFVVCDGVAGLPGGSHAARIARDTLLAQLGNDHPISVEETRLATRKSERAIRDVQKINAKFSRMSTTLAALFINRERLVAWWAHAGDSRIYHFRRGYLNQVTRDHSLARQLEDAGYENTGINSHLLYNALGADTAHDVCFSTETLLEDGDVFLICSDGFWLNITTEEMEQALHMVNTCEEWLSLMKKAISRCPQKDNLSAIAVWIGSPQDTTLLHSLSDSVCFLPPHN